MQGSKTKSQKTLRRNLAAYHREVEMMAHDLRMRLCDLRSPAGGRVIEVFVPRDKGKLTLELAREMFPRL